MNQPPGNGHPPGYPPPQGYPPAQAPQPQYGKGSSQKDAVTAGRS